MPTGVVVFEYDMPSNLGDLFKILFSGIQNTLTLRINVCSVVNFRSTYVIFSAALYKYKQVIRERDYKSINHNFMAVIIFIPPQNCTIVSKNNHSVRDVIYFIC